METMEQLHKPMLKEPYRGTNRKGWQAQVTQLLVRHGKMGEYRDFLEWNVKEDARELVLLCKFS
jgi:hypothetical protein